MKYPAQNNIYDVVIIGAGVTGCAVASYLSAYTARIAVVEKFNDVACGSSKANSGIIHGGFDARPGTLKARFNVEGNAMAEEESRRLDFPFVRNGAMVLAFGAEDEKILQTLMDQGIANGVKGLRIINGCEVRKLEPYVSDNVSAALYCPSSGIVSPYEMTLAYAENACENGVEFFFDSTVESIEEQGGVFTVSAGGRTIRSRSVVNCGGVHADRICSLYRGVHKELMPSFRIIPRKGEYMLSDKTEGGTCRATLFQTPTAMGKGVLVSPTVHGNLIIGPTADDVNDPDDVTTSAQGLSKAFSTALRSIPSLKKKAVITQFAGMRAHADTGDFIIGKAFDGFYNAAGIESPGLTCAPATGRYLAALIAKDLGLSENSGYISVRKGIAHFAQMSDDERAAAIAADPAYGKIVCRCESVTEAEIRDSITRTLGARDLDGVKRRTRAGMGRCQSGFCMPSVMKILAQTLGIPETQVTKCGGGSQIVTGRVDDE